MKLTDALAPAEPASATMCASSSRAAARRSGRRECNASYSRRLPSFTDSTRIRVLAVGDDELRRAAADVDDARDAGRRAGSRSRRRGGSAAPLRARRATSSGSPVRASTSARKSAPFWRLAHRRRRDRADALGPAQSRRLGDESRDRLDAALHRLARSRPRSARRRCPAAPSRAPCRRPATCRTPHRARPR